MMTSAGCRICYLVTYLFSSIVTILTIQRIYHVALLRWCSSSAGRERSASIGLGDVVYDHEPLVTFHVLPVLPNMCCDGVQHMINGLVG